MKWGIIGAGLFSVAGLAALAGVGLYAMSPPAAAPAGQAAANPATAGTPAAEASQVLFSIPDMHCEFACAPKVRETLAGQPGVEKVETNVTDHTASVVVNPQFDEKQAIAALAKVGYTATRMQN